MTPQRLSNVLVAWILGTLVGCALTVLESDEPLPSPDGDRCSGVTLESCIARAQPPDAGTD